MTILQTTAAKYSSILQGLEFAHERSSIKTGTLDSGTPHSGNLDSPAPGTEKLCRVASLLAPYNQEASAEINLIAYFCHNIQQLPKLNLHMAQHPNCINSKAAAMQTLFQIKCLSESTIVQTPLQAIVRATMILATSTEEKTAEVTNTLHFLQLLMNWMGLSDDTTNRRKLKRTENDDVLLEIPDAKRARFN